MVGYWLILAVAVVTEILWALSLKFIQQHPGPWPMVASLGLTLINMTLLSFAMRGHRHVEAVARCLRQGFELHLQPGMVVGTHVHR